MDADSKANRQRSARSCHSADVGGVSPTVDGVDPIEVREFERKVVTMRDNRARGVEVNRFPWQTRIVVRALMEMAEFNGWPVRMFKGTAEPGFYEDLFSAISRVLDTGAHVELVFSEPLSGGVRSKWAELLGDKRFANTFSLRHLAKYDERLFHYVLVGEDAYRLEFPHQRTAFVDARSPERPARFSFNDPAMAAGIAEYAKQIASISIQVE